MIKQEAFELNIHQMTSLSLSTDSLDLLTTDEIKEQLFETIKTLMRVDNVNRSLICSKINLDDRPIDYNGKTLTPSCAVCTLEKQSGWYLFMGEKEAIALINYQLISISPNKLVRT